MESGSVAYVRQQERRGLGHAVWCARHLIGDEPFAVILPDDVIDAETPCLQQMVEAYAEIGGNMVATMEVPHENVSSYGILDVDAAIGPTMPVRGMVEKPKPEVAPSNMAVIGRYILSPQVLRNLDDVEAGAGGEIQLTDAIAARDRARGTTSTPSASRGAASTAARSRATCRRPSPSAWRGPTCATSSSTSCGPSPRAKLGQPAKVAARA